MKKTVLAIIGITIINLLFTGLACASSDYQQWLEEAYPADGPGAAVIVVRDNEVVFRRATR